MLSHPFPPSFPQISDSHPSPFHSSTSDSIFLLIPMFTFLPPPLLSPRPMWSRPPLWGLISAIRRSLLKPGGMFQTTAGAMHSGVACPWTPDLEKLCTPAQVLHHHHWKTTAIFIQCFYVLHVHTISPHLHVLSFSFALYLTSPGTCPISSGLWGTLGKDTQSSCPWHRRLFGWCQDLTMKQRGQTGTGSVSWVLLAFCKRTVSTWPERWHFQNVQIRLRGNIVAIRGVTIRLRVQSETQHRIHGFIYKVWMKANFDGK